MGRFTGTKFWLLGAAYWFVVAALVAVVMQIWPHLQDSLPYMAAIVLGALVGGFAIVYLFQPKS